MLINFDPLLRRQTVLKTENNGHVRVCQSPSACLALVEFAQQETSIENTRLVPLLDTKFESTEQSASHDLGASVLLKDSSELFKTDCETSFQESNREATDDRVVEQAGWQFDKTHAVSACASNTDLVNASENYSQQRNESVDSAAATVHLPLSAICSEQFVQETNDKKRPDSEHLFLETDGPTAPTAQLDVVQPKTHFIEDVLVEKIVSENGKQEQDIREQVPKQGLVAQLESQLVPVPIATPEVNINSIADFATDIPESNALVSSNNMLAEPLQEKQNSANHNMSDDRLVQHGNEHLETGKKHKNEDVHVADMEKKMHDVELREESMLKRITEKDKTISKMSNVVEAYERTIAELISEKEMLIRNHDLECEGLKQDNEINAQHLESLEKTFSNLYAKYERMKKNAIKYKDHEEKLLEKVMKLEECLRAQEQRYEKMKSHAMSQLEIANTKIDEATRNHSQESAKLKAQIKKEEVYRISINEQLIQKSKENEELVKICDELISETN